MKTFAWILGGAAVVGVVWWLSRKDTPFSLAASGSWVCNPGDECTKWRSNGVWHVDTPQRTLSIYSNDPTNFSQLIVVRSMPEYVVYATTKAGTAGLEWMA